MTASKSSENPPENANADQENDEIRTICDIIGNWGPYQSRLFFLYTAIYIIAPTQNIGIIFYTDKVDYACKLPEYTDLSSVTNLSKCHYTQNGSIVPCTEWEYDYSEYQGNLIQEFNLVCDREIYISYAKSIYQVGYLISSLGFGWFSDRHGRRLALRSSILLELTTSLIQATAPNIEIYLVARLFGGIASYSRFLTGMLILLEWAAPENRARVQLFSELGWTVGKFLLPSVYLLILNYRYMQTLVIVWELIMLYPIWKCYPDSPNWLILMGRNQQVEDLLINASRVNQTGDKNYVIGKLDQLKKRIIREEKERESESSKTLLDLFKVPRLLMFSLVIYFMWFSVAFILYGIGYNIRDLGGSLYVNYYVSEILSLIKKLITISIINKFDRRTLMSAFLSMAAISFYATIPFSYDDQYLTYRLTLAMIGKFFHSSCFDLNYLITAEIFPTGMRQIGVGSGSVAARFASISAPFAGEITKRTNLATTMAIYATFALVASAAVWILPKTKDKPIPNTLEEAERRKKPKNPVSA